MYGLTTTTTTTKACTIVLFVVNKENLLIFKREFKFERVIKYIGLPI